MKQTTSTVVINDTESIWPGNPGINDRFWCCDGFVASCELSLGIEIRDEPMLYTDVLGFEKSAILLGLKADEDGVRLAYQFDGLGWNCVPVDFVEQEDLMTTDPMRLQLVMSHYNFQFEREEELPNDFAVALRLALLESSANDTLTNTRANPNSLDLDVVLDNPYAACVIPDRLAIGMGTAPKKRRCPRCGGASSFVVYSPLCSALEEGPYICSKCGNERAWMWSMMTMRGATEEEKMEKLQQDLELWADKER